MTRRVRNSELGVRLQASPFTASWFWKTILKRMGYCILGDPESDRAVPGGSLTAQCLSSADRKNETNT
ncbi:MAG: hypothetical protein QNJ65_13800 [Xenococcaceae cyanobacterium MO_234.B1]|nr:hypothetical protein [Xenococcaceae cyanobacterium MO_234.B1]